MDSKINPGAQPVVVEGSAESAMTLYVDGNVGAALGPGVSKLHFHQVVGATKEGGELRKVVLTLTMPTAALVELCRNALGAISSNSQALQSAYEQQIQVIFKDDGPSK